MDQDISILTLGMKVAWTVRRRGNEATVLNYPSLLACNTASIQVTPPPSQSTCSDREEETLVNLATEGETLVNLATEGRRPWSI